MKKIILVCALLLSVGISTTFAFESKNATQQVLNAFKRDFSDVQEVVWQDSKDFAKAIFKVNDQVMNAYYSTDGELVAVTRNITSGQLPIKLQADVKKGYSNYWISDLFEIASNGNTTYYITLEDSTQKVVLKSNGSLGWESFKKEKKADQ